MGLDTTLEDQGLRQTPENPTAGDNIQVEVFITEGASGEGGFEVEFAWDTQELTFSEFKTQDVFAGALTLETTGDGTMTLGRQSWGKSRKWCGDRLERILRHPTSTSESMPLRESADAFGMC